jgi:DNA sulfur modification protein DndD
MLRNKLEKFIRNKRVEGNIVFRIFEKHLDEILDVKGRFSCSNFISEKIKKIISGEIDKFIYDNYCFEKTPDDVFENIDRKIFLSKVTINGIKGFANIHEFCKEKKNGDCCLQPTLDFIDRKSAVIFGWNGEGKSSLTESIEFALTNDVAEKKRRGISNISEYLLNTDSKTGFVEVELFQPYSPPKRVRIRRIIKNKKDITVQISSDDANDLEMDIRSRFYLYEEFFKKHFVERNRLENFILSRGAENREAYGKLIGLDDLSDFIKNSWKNYDSQCKEEIYSIKTVASEMYKQKETQLNELLKSRIEKPIFEVDEERSMIIKSLDVDGDNIQLENIDTIYDKVVVEIEKIDTAIKTIKDIEDLLLVIEDYKKQLDSRKELSNQVFDSDNINNLYEFYLAAEKVITEDGQECPLCGGKFLYGQKLLTMVKEKIKNMERVKHGITRLKILEDEIAATGQEIYSKTLKYFNDYKLYDFKQDLLSGRIIKKLSIKRENDLTILQNRYQQLQSLKEYIISFKNQYSTYQSVENAIKNLGNDLKAQETEVLKEKQTNQLKKSFLDDINEFEKALKEFYIEELKAELRDISDSIKEYYNKFEPNEQMEIVELQDSEKEFKFYIQFDKNGPKLDPLTVLSEGQLRCFGLAILMSVTKKFNTNFMILDDIVNAIDIEHRANIITVLCEEMQAPNSKQLIITTHDKLFSEKLINSVKNKNGILSFAFENKCMVIENTKNINFEKIIEESIKKKDCRTALVYMRILLENIVYTMADGVVKVEFKDKVYKYELEKVFGAVADHYPELKPIYNYFTVDYNYIYWSILNQESHFWSEQSLCLDCKVIEDIFNKIRCVKNIRDFYRLQQSERNEIKRQKSLEKVDISKFDTNSRIFDLGWFDENYRWTQDFKLLSEII